VHAPSTSAPVSISGSATSFAVAVTPPSLSLSSGQNGTMSITMGSISGFSDSIQMGCLGLPAVVTCTFSSDVISLKSGQTQTVQVTVDSNSPLTGGTSAKATRPGISTTQLAGIFFPGSLGLGCFFWRFRKHRMGMLFAVLALSLATAFGVIGCGAGFSSTKAAAGTYTIQIGGTGITSKISQFQNITLTITK